MSTDLMVVTRGSPSGTGLDDPRLVEREDVMVDHDVDMEDGSDTGDATDEEMNDEDCELPPCPSLSFE